MNLVKFCNENRNFLGFSANGIIKLKRCLEES
jgi:hypothetical protein